MTRLVSLAQVVERAEVHGITYERLQSAKPTVSLQPCPGCRDGFDALVEWDGVGLVYVCNGCEDPAGIRAALPADPETPAAVAAVVDFRTYTPAELLATPQPVWLFEPFLREGCSTELFGAYGVYKSFVAAAWAARSPGSRCTCRPRDRRMISARCSPRGSRRPPDRAECGASRTPSTCSTRAKCRSWLRRCDASRR